MNNGINLLDYKNKINPKQDNSKQRLLRIMSIGLLSIVAALSIIFFILIALSPIPELRKKEKIASFNLSVAHPDIVKLFIIKERAQRIAKLIANRPNYDNILGNIQEKLPSGVSVHSVEIDKKHFSITLSSNSLQQLDVFLNELGKNNASEKEFSQVNIANLSSDEEKKQFLLTLDLNVL